MPAVVNKDLCIGCEACVAVCPTEAISMEEEKAVVDAELCVDCGACEGECPVEAIKVE
ncbi:MAG: 4Fe-4S binding protein [Lentisphaeria bacterium]|jgi:Fe-S-cluster-containing hydrogenase component 2|nr:4Fe-4S binding protein [Lentisphaeria bacterium]